MMIELEHTLIMLFLLVGLLNARPKLPGLLQGVLWGGLVLALVSPETPVSLPWGWLAGLVIPPLLWQNARRLVHARWFEQPADLLVWASLALVIVVMLMLTAGLPVTAALMFGFLVASMAWRALEDEARPSYLGQLGPLALAFLLVEIAPAVEAPQRYLVALLAGSTVGALTGYVAVQLARSTSSSRGREVLAVGQAYFAYAAAVWLGLSGLAAALLSVAVFVAYGIHQGLWPSGNVQPRPFNAPFVFVPAALAFAFFGWQTHVPLTPLLALEVGLGLLLVGIVLIVSGKIGRAAHLHVTSTPLRLLRVALLLTAALLLWPRQVLLDPLPLTLALALAGLAISGTQSSLTPLINLAMWLDQGEIEPEPQGPVLPYPLVRDWMSRAVATVQPDTPLPAVARLLLEQPGGGVLVVDANHALLGIIGEADLFVKETRLPQTDQHHLTLFGSLIQPGELQDIYAQLGINRQASDVMRPPVAWVKAQHSLDQAIQLMAHHHLACLPVLSAPPAEGGRVVGLLTRTALIRRLAALRDPRLRQPPPPRQPPAG